MLLDAGDTDSACSRACYAMYDAARACLTWAGITPERGEFKTHHGLISAFGLQLVKPGHFPAEIGKALRKVQTLRLAADYEAAPVPQDNAEQALAAAGEFVATAWAVIARPYRPSAEQSP